jgi:hypothetical protein
MEIEGNLQILGACVLVTFSTFLIHCLIVVSIFRLHVSHTMAILRVEHNATEFVVNLDNDGFVVVSKRQPYMVGMFQSLIVMAMTNIANNSVHLKKKVVRTMSG